MQFSAPDPSNSQPRSKQQAALHRLQQLAHLITEGGPPSNDIPSNDIHSNDFTLEELDHHGISLLALRNGTLTSNISSQLSSRKAMMVATDDLKNRQLQQLFDALSAAELTSFVVLKGTALAHTVYPQPWLRPRTDTDLLIEKREREKFAKILQQCGFRRLMGIQGRLVSYQDMYSKQLTPECVVNIDLHWKISNLQILAKRLSLQDLLPSASAMSAFEGKALMASPAVNVLVACQHRVGHHYNDERLIWLYDIHLLISTFDHADWDELAKLAHEKEFAAITLDALQLCELLFQTPLRDSAVELLNIGARRDEPSKWFLRQSNSALGLFFMELKSLESWSDKLRFVYENLLPDSEYVKQKTGIENLLLAHLKRLWNGARRLFGFKTAK